MEQTTETFAPSLPPLPVATYDYFNPTCAWCLERMGLPKGEGSHGICRICAAIWLAESKAKRAARRATHAVQPAQDTAVLCQCRTTPDGPVVCDLCTAKKIEALNSQLGTETDTLPIRFEPNELAVVSSRVNAWLSTLP